MTDPYTHEALATAQDGSEWWSPLPERAAKFWAEVPAGKHYNIRNPEGKLFTVRTPCQIRPRQNHDHP